MVWFYLICGPGKENLNVGHQFKLLLQVIGWLPVLVKCFNEKMANLGNPKSNQQNFEAFGQGSCREYFNLLNIPLVLYGAIDGTKDQKGLIY